MITARSPQGGFVSRWVPYDPTAANPETASTYDIKNRRPVVFFDPFSPRNRKRAGVQTQLVEHRRVDIGHIMAVLNGVKPEFIGRPMCHPAADPAAGHPDGEPERVVVASVAML